MMTKNLIAIVIAGHALGASPTDNPGWYLLRPPLRNPGVSVEEIKKRPGWADADREMVEKMFAIENINEGAPLHLWSHDSSYDTAAECEKARRSKYDTAEAKEPALRKEFPGSAPKLTTEIAWLSRCIAVSDPRLIAR